MYTLQKVYSTALQKENGLKPTLLRYHRIFDWAF